MNSVLAERLASIVGGPLAQEIRKRRDQALLRGLDAKRVRDFQYQGELIEGPSREDHESQLRAAELAYKLDGAMPDRIGLDLTGDVRLTPDEELLTLAGLLGVLPAATSTGDPVAESKRTGLALMPAEVVDEKSLAGVGGGVEIRRVAFADVVLEQGIERAAMGAAPDVPAPGVDGAERRSGADGNASRAGDGAAVGRGRAGGERVVEQSEDVAAVRAAGAAAGA